MIFTAWAGWAITVTGNRRRSKWIRRTFVAAPTARGIPISARNLMVATARGLRFVFSH
jgi:hypothetical protein